jgi:hypothetical protein
MTDPKLDLIMLDTHNSYTLAIGDISTYPTGFVISTPTMEVTPPGFPTVSLAFSSQSISIYNAFNLGICSIEDLSESTSLPDGIYKFKYSINPAYKHYVEKTVLRIDVLQEKFDKAFLKTDMSCDTNMKERDSKLLREINLNIQGAIAAANSCALKLAMDLYRRADKQIDDFINQRCYTC